MLDRRYTEAAGMPPNRDPAMDRYQRFGVELEYEGCRRAPALAGTGWRAERDGSLREGGIEFVSDPLTYRDAGPAVRAMMRTAANAACIPTPRCGIHVHMNMRPYTVGQIASVGMVYGLIEPSLFAEFAEGRDLSPFCVPQYANTLLVRHFSHDVTRARQGQGGAPLGNLTGTSKYSALNYSSLRTFGTVEARHMDSTLDPARLIGWIDTLKRMVDYGVQYEDPLYVLDDYERGGLSELQQALIGRELEVDELDQEDAEAACTLIAGHEPQEEEPIYGRGLEFILRDEFEDEMMEELEEGEY